MPDYWLSYYFRFVESIGRGQISSVVMNPWALAGIETQFGFNSLPFQEEDEADLCEGSPRSLEPKSEIYHSIQVESSNLDEDKHNSLVQASKSGEMNDFEEHLKLIDRRLSNMERKMSILLPLMKKTLKDDV